MELLISHATHTLLARNERGHSVEQVWILRGMSEAFAWNLILFSFVREREGYKHHADCTVFGKKYGCFVKTCHFKTFVQCFRQSTDKLTMTPVCTGVWDIQVCGCPHKTAVYYFLLKPLAKV